MQPRNSQSNYLSCAHQLISEAFNLRVFKLGGSLILKCSLLALNLIHLLFEAERDVFEPLLDQVIHDVAVHIQALSLKHRQSDLHEGEELGMVLKWRVEQAHLTL